MTRFAAALLAGLGALTFVADPAFGQQVPSRPAGRSWAITTTAASVFDTNLDHELVAESAYGFIAGAGVRWRDDPSDPSLDIEYEAALHSYSGDDRWDRVSHQLRASWEVELGKRWTWEVVGEGSRRGSSEDRELADVAVVEPRIAFEPLSATRIRLAAAYRRKWYEDNPGRDAVHPYLELELRQRLPGGWRVEAGPRYEWTETPDPDYRYVRWTYGVGLGGSIGSQAALDLEVKYRDRRYTDRIVEIEDEDGDDEEFLRWDHDWWIASATWTQRVGGGLQIELGYKFETRSSNDPDKAFDAHQLTLGTRATW
jgi:hypothetical protein